MERILRINPECTVFAHNMFYLPGNSSEIDFGSFDCVIDAVDTVTAKLEIISRASISDVSVISCMGTGNKLDLTRLRVGMLSETSVCPLARVMRREVRAKGLPDVKVVWSDEPPLSTSSDEKRVPSSLIFVPAAAGLLLAREALNVLLRTGKVK